MDIVSHRREEKRDKLISTCDGLERRGRSAVRFNWHVLAEYKVASNPGSLSGRGFEARGRMFFNFAVTANSLNVGDSLHITLYYPLATYHKRDARVLVSTMCSAGACVRDSLSSSELLVS